MPGFGRNTRNIQNGGALTPAFLGTKRFPLSEASSSFLPIVVTSGTAATEAACLHSGSLTAMDELYLWAVNNGQASSEITISFDDDRTGFIAFTAQPVITTLQPSGGAVLIWPGIPIISVNETTPTVVYASGSASSRISIHGYVMRRNRIIPTDANQGYDGQE
tara:strand:- start:71 stop:559 length:489 start_codon:yes stop_codon:yes gene_type:complete